MRSLLGATQPDGWWQRVNHSSSANSISDLVVDDAVVSSQHIRIYTIIFDKENPGEVDPLVYAEDLSWNGAYWNGTLIGKGKGGFLLSDGDKLRISPRISFRFMREQAIQEVQFDSKQQHEMQVSRESL